MRITQTFLFTFIITLISCNATKKLPVTTYDTGKVTYTIEIDTDNEVVKEKFGTEAVIEFNQDLLKFTKNDKGSGFEYQLIDFQKNNTWNYLNFLDNKFRVLEDESMRPEIGDPVFHDEYKTIGAFKCQKMTAPMAGGEMTAFITKELKVNYCPYLEVEGFALEYTLPLPFGEVHYKMSKFEAITPTLSLDNNYTTYSSIKEFQASLQKNTDQLINRKITDLNIQDINENNFKSENLIDKITVFNFWFTSCAPCITEIPDLNKLKEKYINAPVQFLAITFDDAEKVLPFLEKHPFNYTIFTNQKALVNQLEIRSFPTTFITDKSGIIIHSESGGSFSIFEDLDTIIADALKK